MMKIASIQTVMLAIVCELRDAARWRSAIVNEELRMKKFTTNQVIIFYLVSVCVIAVASLLLHILLLIIGDIIATALFAVVMVRRSGTMDA